MAEALLVVAVQELGKFIFNKLVGKLASLNEVRSNAEFLRDELAFMVSFLKDAEQKQEADHRVQHWISDVRKIAEDITFVLADFDDKMGTQQNVAAANKTSSCLEAVRLYACICGKGTDTFDIGEQFMLLKKRVEAISTRRERYGIINISINTGGEQSSASKLKALRRTTSYADSEQLFVGLEDVKHKLVEELLNGKSRRSVVSIHGMGGLGKTTLARNLYNSPELVSRFDMRAWICVSQEYDIPNLLRAAIKSFLKETDHEERVRIENMDVDDLERYLRGMLKDSVFLVVVDDVWEKEAWESLKRAFPDCSNGSRVIVTTRNMDVATQIDERVYAHHLRFLDSEESWDLFMAKLSHVHGQADWCSDAVEDLGREMVAKCGGLPLALVVLGGLLAYKKTRPGWLKVKEHLWANLAESIEISHLLSLSYSDLSSELKQCFLYLGIFPEDSLIDAEELMCLWMGETFIQEGEDMEDVAESFLNELINRSLLQVAERLWERIAKCRIHDLLRDLAIKKALDVGLFHIFNPAGTDQYSLVQHHRHVVHTTSHIKRYLSVDHSNTRLRSLLLFTNIHLQQGHEIPPLSVEINKYSNLGVLKIEGAVLVRDESAIIIGNLKKLKSLVLVNTLIMNLPSSITNLTCLQTLIVFSEERGPCELPKEMSKLTNLRHLISDTIQGEAKIGNLSKLRTLKNISYASWIAMEKKEGLVYLRELVIRNIFQQDNVASCPLNSLGKLKLLHTLVLSCGRRDSLGSLDFLSSCQSLHKLWLDGRIDMLPPVEKWPKSISVLNLSGSKLKEDPIPVLGMLPILTRLDLTESHASSTMDFSSQSFLQLEILNIHKLFGLERITLEEGAAPRLKRLYVNKNQCPGLRKIPRKLKPILVPSHGERDESFYPSRYFPRLD